MKDNRYEQLARLAALRDRGALSDDEFEREKQLILSAEDVPLPESEPSFFSVQEFIDSEEFSNRIEFSVTRYRQKFSKYVAKTGVYGEDLNEAISKRFFPLVTWNWAGFFFGPFWAFWRGLYFLPILLAICLIIIGSAFFPAISNALSAVSIMFAVLGNNLLFECTAKSFLRDEERSFLSTPTPSLGRLLIGIVAVVASTGAAVTIEEGPGWLSALEVVGNDSDVEAATKNDLNDVRAMLFAGDTKVCVNDEVKSSIIDSIFMQVIKTDIDFVYNEFEGTVSHSLDAIKAESINSSISEVTCGGNFSIWDRTFFVNYSISPSLDDDYGFVTQLDIDDITTQRLRTLGRSLNAIQQMQKWSEDYARRKESSLSPTSSPETSQTIRNDTLDQPEPTTTRNTVSSAEAISPSEAIAILSRELRPHWTPPFGQAGELLVTVVSFDLNRDGSLAGTPRVIRQNGITEANRHLAAEHARRAIRAVQLAAPFELPEESYVIWRHVSAFSFGTRLGQ